MFLYTRFFFIVTSRLFASNSSTTAHSLPAVVASVGDDRREGGSSTQHGQLAAAPSVGDDRCRERFDFTVTEIAANN